MIKFSDGNAVMPFMIKDNKNCCVDLCVKNIIVTSKGNSLKIQKALAAAARMIKRTKGFLVSFNFIVLKIISRLRFPYSPTKLGIITRTRL